MRKKDDNFTPLINEPSGSEIEMKDKFSRAGEKEDIHLDHVI
jgi:hypothetical protein